MLNLAKFRRRNFAYGAFWLVSRPVFTNIERSVDCVVDVGFRKLISSVKSAHFRKKNFEICLSKLIPKLISNVKGALHIYIYNATVTENDQRVHPQLQHKSSVAIEIQSQPCWSVSEAGCPRLTATFLSVRRLFSVLGAICDKHIPKTWESRELISRESVGHCIAMMSFECRYFSYGAFSSWYIFEMQKNTR